MKRIATLVIAVLLTLSLSACADYAENTAGSSATGGASYDNIFTVLHLSGHHEETEVPVYVLFEYETLKYTKYQFAFLA